MSAAEEAGGGGMTPPGFEPVLQELEERGVKHELVEHEATYTAKAEARVTDAAPGEVAKTVVLHDGPEYMLAVLPASERLDVYKLRDILDAGAAMRLATESEMARDFPQFELGAVPPLGAMPAAEVVDERLMQADRVLFSAGDHRHGVWVDPRDLVRAAAAKVGDICED